MLSLLGRQISNRQSSRSPMSRGGRCDAKSVSLLRLKALQDSSPGEIRNMVSSLGGLPSNAANTELAHLENRSQHGCRQGRPTYSHKGTASQANQRARCWYFRIQDQRKGKGRPDPKLPTNHLLLRTQVKEASKAVRSHSSSRQYRLLHIRTKRFPAFAIHRIA